MFMPNWSIHHLDLQARGDLRPHDETIETAIRLVERLSAMVVKPVAVDIVVQPVNEFVIPELGFVGNAPRPGVIYFSFDPANENLSANLGAPLQRMIAHEYHHLLRMKGAGYGRTLIEVIVSEGLAGRFAQELFKSDAEPWECTVPVTDLSPYAKRILADRDAPTFNYPEWFFGAGILPRWLGYTLGWEIVGDYLRRNADARPSGLARIEATEFLRSFETLADG
jgi:uncharacterized protein YjaZ